MTSCGSAKYLQDGETFLRKNSINITDSKRSDDVQRLKYELEGFCVQKPNAKLIGIPTRFFYYRQHGDQKSNVFVPTWVQRKHGERDTSVFYKWFNKRYPEKPAVFDSTMAVESASRIKKYLRNKKGYYNAEVDFEDIKFRHFTNVTYDVALNQRYHVKSMVYYGDDDNVINLLTEHKAASLIKAGTPLNAVTFDLEKQRIVNLLQNNGYADFNINYINIQGDSSAVQHQVEVFVQIDSPHYGTEHRIYRIGNVDVYTDYLQTPRQTYKEQNVTVVNDIEYHSQEGEYIVDIGTIDSKILLRPDELYRKDDYYATMTKLSNLSTYKFARVESQIVDTTNHIVNYQILLTPHDKKWVGDIGNDFFYSTINTVGRRQLGVSLSGNLLNRNTLGGSEANRLSAEAGVEFELQTPIRTNSLLFNLTNTLDIPKNVDVLGTFRLMNKLGVLSDMRYKDIKQNTNTSVSTSVGFQRIFNALDVTSASVNLGYIYTKQNRQIALKQLGASVSLYDLKPAFQESLANNPLLRNSLKNNLFTGLLFSELSHYIKLPNNIKNSSLTLRTSAEVSGFEVFVVNKLISPDTPWVLSDKIDFANFVKLSFDTRYLKDFGNERAFASRLFVGIAMPYYNDISVPFVKQFYVGGPNSIRAWQVRELGPGSYFDAQDILDNLYYQTGDIRIEANAELRADLFYIFEGALFVDVGNVWTLNDGTNRPGSQISWSFLNQFAIGAGYGVRMDFSYFKLRLDFGYKILNPYPTGEELTRWLPKQSLLGNLNLAINYPF